MPWPKPFDRKGCRNVALRSARLLLPATDQIWFAKTPTDHAVGVCFRNSTVGPRPHLPLPSEGSVAVGSKIAGPMPTIQPPGNGSLGVKKKLCVISPNPD